MLKAVNGKDFVLTTKRDFELKYKPLGYVLENKGAIGDKIKIIRKFYNYTQKEFASIINVSHAHISKIESGNDYPSQSLLTVITNRFNVSPTWIEEESEAAYQVEFMINDYNTFINNLIYLRQRDDKTKSEMKVTLGIERYASFENKKSSIRLSKYEADKICNYYKISIDDVINKTLYPVTENNSKEPDLSKEELALLEIFRDFDDEEKNLILTLAKKIRD